jgi:hypothetical protein
MITSLWILLALGAVFLIGTLLLRLRDHFAPARTLGDASTSVPVAIEGGDLVCGALRVHISEIKVVGEATNRDGPWAEDWFLCLVTSPDGTWINIPMNSLGTRTYELLIARLAIAEPWRLGNSTDFASCVVWPAELQNQQMFLFERAAPHTQIGRWLQQIGIQPSGYVQRLAEPVVACAAA